MNNDHVFKLGFFTNSPMIGVVFDATTHRFVDMNDAALDHYGYSREEMLQMMPYQLMPSDEPTNPLFVNVLKRLKEGESIMLQTRHTRKDGKELYLVYQLTLAQYENQLCYL